MTTTWLRDGFLVSILGLIATLGAGCSAKEDAPKFPTTDTFCAEKAKIECAAVAPTCGVPTDGCVTARKEKCAQFAASAVTPTRAYKPENAEACLTAVTAAYSDKKLTVKEEDTAVSGSMGERCARVFEGKAVKGGDCTSTFDCGGGLVCAARVGGNKPVCAQKEPKNSGEGCANAGETSAAGTFCDVTTAVCVAAKKKDDACNTTDSASTSYAPCGDTFRCDGAPPAAKCVDRVGSGGACTTHADCAADVPYCYEAASGKKCTTELIFSIDTVACRDYGKTL